MPLNLTNFQQNEFERLRSEWLDLIRPLDGFVVSNFIQKVPEISQTALSHAQLMSNRHALIRELGIGGVVAEIGTQEGIFSDFILGSTQPDELHLFDIDFSPYHAVGRVDDERVVLHEGDSSTLLSTFPVDYFDWIYIDGDHSYDGAKADAEIAVTRVKPGGTLVFNDFTIWSPAEMIDYGIPYVVSELIRDFDLEVTYLALHPLGYHDIAVRRG